MPLRTINYSASFENEFLSYTRGINQTVNFFLKPQTLVASMTSFNVSMSAKTFFLQSNTDTTSSTINLGRANEPFRHYSNHTLDFRCRKI